MKITFTIPSVEQAPAHRPRACVYCGQPILQRHGTVSKPIKDHRFSRVIAHRYKCVSCGRTFRHYPTGITKKDQSRRTVVLAALMYGLGLSSSAAARLLGALGAQVDKITVWRDAQEVGEAPRRRPPAGKVRVLGLDATVYRAKGREVVVSFVVEGQSERAFFEVLFEGDVQAFKEWLELYAKELGAEVLVSDDNHSYRVATARLGLSRLFWRRLWRRKSRAEGLPKRLSQIRPPPVKRSPYITLSSDSPVC